MSERLCVVMEAHNKAPSQYINMPFDSVVSFNGKAVFFGESGVFEESGQTDNGTDIPAWFDTPALDLGARDQKSIEAFDIGYETSGELALTLFGDENEYHAREFSLKPVFKDGVQQDGMRTLKKYHHGNARYWKVRVANVNGCDFSVDSLALAPVFLKRRAQP